MVRKAILMVSAAALLAAFEGMRPALAMPPFAQAYNYNCTQCHTAVPALNAFGRYVQRTGYSALDVQTIHHVSPLWVGESAFYDSQDSSQPHRIQLGNFAVHAVGFVGADVTFHLQQWVDQANQPGGTDTFWFSYNNLAHRNAHLFVGKVEAPAPSPYSQWFELASFDQSSITVGEHAWQYAANRWGTKLDYTHGWVNAQIGYLGSNGDLNTATDFGSSTERSVQWWLSSALPDRPVEFGAYGVRGSFPLSNGSLDRYHGSAANAEIDPGKSLPGAFVVYQRGVDDQPSPGSGAAGHKALAVDLYHPFFRDRTMLGLRTEFLDDGLGNVTHSTNLDVEWLAIRKVTPQNTAGLLFNAEYARMSTGTPQWRYQLWFVTTLRALGK